MAVVSRLEHPAARAWRRARRRRGVRRAAPCTLDEPSWAGRGILAQFFPLFLLGALFGKLMEDSGSVRSHARFMTDTLGSKRISPWCWPAPSSRRRRDLFVAIFVVAPMAEGLFKPRHPAA